MYPEGLVAMLSSQNPLINCAGQICPICFLDHVPISMSNCTAELEQRSSIIGDAIRSRILVVAEIP